MRKFKIGVMGYGNMANAICEGILDARLASSEQIIVSDVDKNRLDFASKKGLIVTQDNKDIDAKYIILAVKPQTFAEVAKDILINKDTVLISIMAGVTIQTLREHTQAKKIVRVMPNTPCMIKKGISALAFDNVDKADREYIFSLFASIGEALEISEDKFDAVTSLSGSGPAYIYTFIKGLIEGGVDGGLTYEQAKKLAVMTMLGAAEMVGRTDTNLEQLIGAVSSKGGTTIEALRVFKERKLVDAIVEGVAAARERARELSKL